MVGRKSRPARRQKLMGSHNRCWLWGRHVVLETLAAGRWPIVELRLSTDLEASAKNTVETQAAEREIPVTIESPERLRTLCRADDHQGYLAKMRPFPFLNVDELLTGRRAGQHLCVLDGIQDPHNFGAIIRSAEVLGIAGMIVGQSRQSDVTAIVARSSAGAINHLPLARTEDLTTTARVLRDEYGFQLVAADHHAEHSPAEVDWTRPSVLLIGNEATGLGRALSDLCQEHVCIPQRGQTESLNAAAAAGILFYEMGRGAGEQ